MSKYVFTNQTAGIRLDVLIATNMQEISRSFGKKLIEQGKVLVNGKTIVECKKLQLYDVVEVEYIKEQDSALIPKNLPIEILYEDEFIAVINKPQNLVVHSGGGTKDNTLVNALLYNFKNLSTVSGEHRPGIVHRLDKDTSGIIVIAKTDQAHNHLAAQIKNRTMRRVYIALVDGIVKHQSGLIDAKIGRHPKYRTKMAVIASGKDAQTKYKVLARYKKNTLCEFELISGRTHQIRVHSKHIGHPVCGDRVYGKENKHYNQLLHSHYVEFLHPNTNKIVSFTAPLPSAFKQVLDGLN